MLDTVDAALGQLEQAAQNAQAIERPEDALAFLRAVYQSPAVPLSVRMRAAIEALPFEKPSLKATAVMFGGDDFASALDRALERSANARHVVIEPKGIEASSAIVADHTPPPPVPDRRFRRA